MTPNSSLILLTTLLLFFTPLQAAFFNNTLASVNAASADKTIAPDAVIIPAARLARAKGRTKEGKIINLEVLTQNPRAAGATFAAEAASLQIKTVVIDAGHGGHDPGCSGADSHEKHLALAIAKAFAANIRANYPDIQVILTRDEDVFIPLHERAAIANRARADLFISIHCNAMPPNNGGTWGSETYVMGLHTADHNLDVAKRENNAILLEENYERNYDYDPNSPEGHILLSMFQNAFLEQSILFAERVEHHFHHTAQRRSRGVKQAGFVVLKETAMPSVLVETGFLTSKKDEAFLKSEEGQALVANALLVAFSEYKALVEGVAVAPVQFATADPEATYIAPEPTPARADYQAPVVDYQSPPVTPQPTLQPTTYQYTDTYTPPSATNVRAEPAIIPNTQVRGTVSVPVPANDRALEPKSVGNTNWALEIGQDQANTSLSAPGLLFCVQLAAAPQPLDTRAPVWQNNNYLIEVIQETDMYKYQVRNFPRLAEANNARIVLQNQGFQDAFVVAYYQGQRITMGEAQALLSQQ